MRKLRESGKMHFAHVARGYSLVRVCVYRRVMRSAGPVYRSPDSMVSTPLLRGNGQPFCAHPHAAHIYASESKPTSHRTERRPVKHHILPPPPSKTARLCLLQTGGTCFTPGPNSRCAASDAQVQYWHAHSGDVHASIQVPVEGGCLCAARLLSSHFAQQVASLSQSQEMFPKVVGTRDNVVSVWGCGTHPCSACF